MPEAIREPNSPTNPGCRKWWADVSELVQARYELAEAEIRGDADLARRMGILAGIGVLAVLCGLPLLLVLLADYLAAVTVISREVWLGGIGGGAVLLGLLLMWASWLRFRRNFCGLQESIEELREDVAWLREWMGSPPSDE